MPFAFLIPAAASLIGGSMQARAAKSAASTEAAQQQKALDLQQRMYEEGVARQQPFLQTGTEAFNRLAALQRGGPESAQQFLQMDPGYQFRLSEGMKALDRQAAARGGLISGGALKAAQRYGQDLGSQEFGAAYNRLAGLADVGPRAAGVMSGLGQQYATGAGNIYGSMGQSAGQADIARGSAYGRSLNRLGDIAGEYYGRQQQPAPSGAVVSTPYDYGVDQQFSDRRLKTNITKIGTRADGLNVYEFDYVWGGPRQVGLMAQEVQSVYPEAIGVRDGYLTVDYGKV